MNDLKTMTPQVAEILRDSLVAQLADVVGQLERTPWFMRRRRRRLRELATSFAAEAWSLGLIAERRRT